MEQECKITNRDWQELNQRLTMNEDNFKFIRDTLARIEASVTDQTLSFEKFKSWSRDDLAHIQTQWGERFDTLVKGSYELIGEVPKGKTVMQCIRDNETDRDDTDKKVNKIYIIASVIGAIYVLLTPLLNPLIRKFFGINY